jgi:ABC-type Co2+ transport system permease subunit
VVIEALVTGSALQLIAKAKPEMLDKRKTALSGSS